MARMLAALSHKPEGLTRRRLMKSMDLPDNDNGERIFRRDLRELKEMGLDISSVKVNNEERYRLHIVDHRIRAAFTREERHELARVAQRAGLGALYDDLTPGEADVANAPEALAADDVETVSHAVMYRCLLHFDYHGRDRIIHPYEIIAQGNRWLLRGRDDREDRTKSFYIDEMVGLRPDAPGSAEAMPAALTPMPSNPVRFQVHAPVKVTLTMSPTDEPVASAALTSGSVVAHTTRLGTDRVRMEVVTTNLEGFITRVFELGPRVKLEGPPEARSLARRHLAWVWGSHA